MCFSKEVTLFSIIALEKFAKTNENKEYIKVSVVVLLVTVGLLNSSYFLNVTL